MTYPRSIAQSTKSAALMENGTTLKKNMDRVFFVLIMKTIASIHATANQTKISNAIGTTLLFTGMRRVTEDNCSVNVPAF
jgi:hypothetical protein